MWGWNVICAPDIFTWNFLFVLLNMGQVLHIIYQMRPVKFNQELEELYSTLFEPLRVGAHCTTAVSELTKTFRLEITSPEA